jgi:hypothetical protein
MERQPDDSRPKRLLPALLLLARRLVRVARSVLSLALTALKLAGLYLLDFLTFAVGEILKFLLSVFSMAIGAFSKQDRRRS